MVKPEKDRFVHEDSYRWRNPAGFVHRARLEAIHRVLGRHVTGPISSWADFGCSNGYVIEQVLKRGYIDVKTIVGFDHSEELLELARSKALPRTRFQHFDLNHETRPSDRFSLVTCFETLEHIGAFRQAIRNLYCHLDEEGLLVVTVPNETGWVGLEKLLGRRLLRRSTDREFFERTRFSVYARSLLLNRHIDGFRDPDRPGYSSHLGFDYRRLREFIRSEFVAEGLLTAVTEKHTTLGLNHLSVFRRATR